MRFRLPSAFSLLLVLSLELAAQRPPGVLEAKRGEQLYEGYELRTRGRLFQKSTVTRPAALVAQLPVDKLSARSRLVGVFDFDGDGQQEVFLGWRTSPEAPFVHHFQVYRIQSKGAVFLGQFSFEGGPVAGIAFYESRGRADTPKTVFEVMGGAKWGTFYLLGPNGQSAPKIGSGTNYEFTDLEKNGVYNLILYGERPFEPVCTVFGFQSLSPGLFPTVFRRDGFGYVKIWPPAEWLSYDFQLLGRLKGVKTPPFGKRYAVMASIYDIDRDGAPDIVALTDSVQQRDTKRMLEIYAVTGGALILKSQVAVAHPHMAVAIYGLRRLRGTTQVVLLLADPHDCGAESNHLPSLTMEGFDFRQGRLTQVWRRQFDQFFPYLPAAVTDVDHVGEEEMTFPDSNGLPFLTLRKESEFVAPSQKVLCAIGCPPFCSDAYTKGPVCQAEIKSPRKK
jgi:hypothetical protein